MLTVADVIEIMTVVAACHPRSAPRMDDKATTLATATIWQELLDGYGIDKAEYINAIKHRARGTNEAPEPSEMILVARDLRKQVKDRDVDYHETGPNQGSAVYPGDDKAAPDPGPYPREWTAAQRVDAYWHAHRLHAVPTSTAGWHAIMEQLETHREQHESMRDGVDA